MASDVAERASDASDLHPSSGDEASGDNWLAQAFRRRQEEQRAKEILNARSRDWTQATESKASPVDDWLVAGFRRHEEEQRHVAEITGALDAAPPSAETGLPISGAPRPVPAPDTGLVPTPDRGIALKTERSPVAGRRILIGGLIVIGGLFSILALRTALFAPPQSPAPPKAPPAASKANPPEGASLPVETTNPAATKPIETDSGPASDAAGPEPAPGEGVPTEIKEAPSETNAGAAPSAPAAPMTPQEQGLAAPEGQQKPPSGPSSLGNGSKPEAPPPVETEGKLNAEPRAIGPIKSRETTEPQKDQNAAEVKRPTAGKKTKAVKAKSSAGRRSSAGTDPFSSFLARTTNSVRKFFGRLGQNGGRVSK